MNQFLAEMYGTRETIGAPAQSDDTEKLAEAQLLDDALRSEGIDVDTLSPEAILKVAQSLFPEGALVKAAAEEGEPKEHEDDETPAHERAEEAGAKAKEGEGETAEEKVAQADFLGRVMAHSYMQEKAEIEKEAAVSDIAGKAKGLAHKAWGGIQSAAKAEHLRGGLKTMKEGKHLKGMGEAAKEMGKHSPKRAKQFGEIAGKRLAAGAEAHKKGLKGAIRGAAETGGLYGGGAAAIGGAGYAAGHKKESSALDTLAEQRALEILDENGIGQNGDEKLASAVEQRAWEMLAENGYVSEE